MEKQLHGDSPPAPDTGCSLSESAKAPGSPPVKLRLTHCPMFNYWNSGASFLPDNSFVFPEVVARIFCRGLTRFYTKRMKVGKLLTWRKYCLLWSVFGGTGQRVETISKENSFRKNSQEE